MSTMEISNPNPHGYPGELHPLPDYTRELKKRLPKDIFQPIPMRLLWMIPHLALIAGAAYIIAVWTPHWAISLPLSLLIGSSFAGLGFLGHEILHGSVTRTPWLRNLAGQICFWPFSLGPRLWRQWHNIEHHGHTQLEGEDPDAMHTLEAFHERPSLKHIYRLAPWLRAVLMFLAFSFWFSMHAVQMFLDYCRDYSGRRRVLVIAQFILPTAFWLGLLWWVGPVAWLYIYLIPLLVGNFIVMSYIATNHLLSPLTPVNDPLANSLTVVVPRWVDVLHLNFSHHVEHHIFPGLNPKFAPAVKRLCKELWADRYQEMPHWKAVLMVCLTPRVYDRYTRLVDPVRNLAYPVAGHGLNPDRLQAQPFRPREDEDHRPE